MAQVQTRTKEDGGKARAVVLRYLLTGPRTRAEVLDDCAARCDSLAGCARAHATLRELGHVDREDDSKRPRWRVTEAGRAWLASRGVRS